MWNNWILFASSVIDEELTAFLDSAKKRKVMVLYAAAKSYAANSVGIEQRARYFQSKGIKIKDSMHLATAEMNDVDVFLTTDDKFLRAARKLNLGMKIWNPVQFLMEVKYNGE